MKISELLKKIGIDIEAEYNDASTETFEEINEVNKNTDVDSAKDSSVEDIKTDETKVKAEEEKTLKLVFDDKTGLFDLSGIEDEEVKAVLKKANSTVKATADKVKINKAVEVKLESLKLNKGITSDAVRKLADLTNVKVDNEGNVTGIDEAFDSLAKEQSGLFLADKGTEDKTQTSNPMLEGFNPQTSVQQGAVANSFTEAFNMMEQ